MTGLEELERREVPFQREERFIVVKRKHLSAFQEKALRGYMDHIGIGTVECAVIESDWPEYETVWQMIEARCTGKPIAKAREANEPRAENERLRDAAASVIGQAFDHYTARNGCRCSIEGDDGEKCWIVPFDAFEDLRAALGGGEVMGTGSTGVAAPYDIALLRRALAYAQGEQVRLMSERTELGRALSRIADAEYAHHLSGNQNFECLQTIVREVRSAFRHASEQAAMADVMADGALEGIARSARSRLAAEDRKGSTVADSYGGDGASAAPTRRT